jgi:hypothetical protein
MAGHFEVPPSITVSGHGLGLTRRDMTGLPGRVRLAAKSVSIYSAVVILRANPAVQQRLERRCHMKRHPLGWVPRLSPSQLGFLSPVVHARLTK